MKANQLKELLQVSKLLILIVVMLIVKDSKAQDSPYLKKVTYKVTILKNSDYSVSSGYLASFSDSSVHVSASAVNFRGYANTNLHSLNVHYNDISDISLKRKGSTVTGILIGAISLAAIGVVAGFGSGDDPPVDPNVFIRFSSPVTAGEKAQLLGLAGAATGGIIGALLGSVNNKTFIIKGKKEPFDELKYWLKH